MRRRGPYFKPLKLAALADDVPQMMLESLVGQAPVAELIRVTFRVLVDLVKPSNRAVFEDQFMERLPSWLGRDFAVDLVLRERLALTQKISAMMLEMPVQFGEAEARAVADRHAAAHRSRTVLAKSMASSEGAVDWADVAAVLQAEQWVALESQFLDTDASHANTLLAITADERLRLARHGVLATLIANVATQALRGNRFHDALALFDAAIEGKIDPGAAANPLFAVQDDNNHLGIDRPRARRYLERCLPHGPRNPTVFLNGVFVAMELDDHAQALELLGLAKAAGLPIKQYKNERLLTPLRGSARFNTLMR